MIKPSSRLTSLLRFLEIDPGNLTLRKHAIRECFEHAQWDIARDLIDGGLSSHPADLGLLEASGLSHLQAQRYPDAEWALRASLKNGDGRGEVRYQLAFALFMQARCAEALEHLNELATSPSPAGTLVLRARCAYHLRRPDDAIADLEAHLELFPADPEASGVLALVLQEQGRDDAAREHAATALGHNPAQVEALLATAQMHSAEQRNDDARAAFDAIVEVDPRCGRAWLGLALLDLGDLRIESAVRHTGAAATHMPDHIGTWHVMAWAKLMLGDVAGARAAFEQALGIDRNFGETHGGLAVVAAMEGRDEDARLSIKRAVRLNAQSLSAKYAELVLLERQGQYQEALATLEAVLARPVSQGDRTFADLLTAHVNHLRKRSAAAGSTVYH